MIVSMTGYATLEQRLESGVLSVELRSVNHRFLELTMRLDDNFRHLETEFREILTAYFKRGKVECRLNWLPSQAPADQISLDFALVEYLSNLERQIKNVLPAAAALSVAEILRWPGVVNGKAAQLDGMQEMAVGLLKETAESLKAARIREGDKLQAVMVGKVDEMESQVAIVAPLIPDLLQAYQQKLALKFQEVLGTQDDERIRQELTMFAQKIDVDEELSRLKTHLSEVRRILKEGGSVGKRMDFMLQELNREANTLGSKSVSTETSNVSMALKLLIEQIREQVQNVE